MPKLYTRATALSNVCHRVNYISSPKKQEKLLASYDGASELMGGRFWTTLARECQAAFKQSNKKTRVVINRRTGERTEKELKCCEGRELMFKLPNSLLNRLSPQQIAEIVSAEIEEKTGRPTAVGVHWKHFADGKDNLHVHAVFPERMLLSEPVLKIAERNLFFDAEGKRRYKKSEILDENKNLLPGCKIVKKGEVYEKKYFSTVDQRFYDRRWLKSFKTNVILKLLNNELRGDEKITEYDPSTGQLPLQHVGNNVPKAVAERIKQDNDRVVEYNQYVIDEIVVPEEAQKNLKDYKQAMRNGDFTFLRNLLERVKEKARGVVERKLSLFEQIANAKKKAVAQTPSIPSERRDFGGR